MAVIITQVVQFSNLPAASQGILILNLNSLSLSFSLPLSSLKAHQEKGKTELEETINGYNRDIKQRR